MDEFKGLFASKTVWGALIALVAGLLSLFGYTIAPADQMELVTVVAGVGAMAGAVLAIIGRAVASKKIGKGPGT